MMPNAGSPYLQDSATFHLLFVGPPGESVVRAAVTDRKLHSRTFLPQQPRTLNIKMYISCLLPL